MGLQRVRRWKAGLTSGAHGFMLNLESRLDISPVITNRVKQLRGARQWTQEELAAAVGVSRQSINSIEREDS